MTLAEAFNRINKAFGANRVEVDRFSNKLGQERIHSCICRGRRLSATNRQ
jgi:hypothetical protein